MPLVWPVSLPPLQAADTRFRRKDGVVRTQMDDGTFKQRLSSTKPHKSFKTSLELTGAQMAVWDQFLEDGGRVIAFEWKDPITGNAYNVRLTNPDVEWAVYIPADPLKRRWRATLEFEVIGPVVV